MDIAILIKICLNKLVYISSTIVLNSKEIATKCMASRLFALFEPTLQ